MDDDEEEEEGMDGKVGLFMGIGTLIYLLQFT